MSMLRMMESRLPPGFRFHPRDEELVCDYLAKRAASTTAAADDMIMEVINLNNCEPWELPETACLGGKEWYFFSLRDRKYATGQRMNRATKSGFWKATGKDRPVVRQGSLVGMRKTLVFYQGRAPKGTKTHWVMHEFRTEGLHRPSNFAFEEDWVLCRVFCKSREDASKANMPPLMDSYVGLNQASMALEGGCKQVTCSSNPTSNYATPCTDPLERTSPSPTKSLAFGGLSYCWGTLPSEKNLIEVPSENQTTPCTELAPSLVEGGYSSEADLHCMWNSF